MGWAEAGTRQDLAFWFHLYTPALDNSQELLEGPGHLWVSERLKGGQAVI